MIRRANQPAGSGAAALALPPLPCPAAATAGPPPPPLPPSLLLLGRKEPRQWYTLAGPGTGRQEHAIVRPMEEKRRAAQHRADPPVFPRPREGSCLWLPWWQRSAEIGIPSQFIQHELLNCKGEKQYDYKKSAKLPVMLT